MPKAIVLRFDTDQQREALKDEAAALPGKVSLNTYIITLLTTHHDRKKVKARAKKGK
jgi:predicted HicB family RNase H-like nuclease